MSRYRKVASYATAQDLAEYASGCGLTLPSLLDDPAAVLERPWSIDDRECGRRRIGNRWTILPMEGWDAERSGAPSDLVRRRWLRFATSGAKLLWFEATAVRHEGRANPRQLVLDAAHQPAFTRLLHEVLDAHRSAFERTDDLLTGLQLTHSGRWCRPDGEPRPRVAYRHPYLDARVGVDSDASVFTDDELDALSDDFIEAAHRAAEAGFDFVDIKHCHGYLTHELLSAQTRSGRYGGALSERCHFLDRTVAGIRARCPELAIAVRFSAFDFQPFQPGPQRVGEPVTDAEYPYAFGADRTGLAIDWPAIEAFVEHLRTLGIGLVCVTAGSPYYTPHIQRPAFFPPSDGYHPPEEPLVGVARMLGVARQIKQRFPDLGVVGTGLSYLQQHIAPFAGGCVADGWMDSVGLGRMSLSYPNLPAQVLARQPLARKAFCRTFSDCTTAPRNGMISGCYPLDDYYRELPEYERLKAIKKDL